MSCMMSSKMSCDAALSDAEGKLRNAKEEVANLESAIRVCKKKIASREPWPGSVGYKVTKNPATHF